MDNITYPVGTLVTYNNPQMIGRFGIGDLEQPLRHGTQGIVFDHHGYKKVALNAKHGDDSKSVFVLMFETRLFEAARYPADQVVVVTGCAMHRGNVAKVVRDSGEVIRLEDGCVEVSAGLRPLWFVDLYPDLLTDEHRAQIVAAVAAYRAANTASAPVEPPAAQSALIEPPLAAQPADPQGVPGPASVAAAEAFYRAAAKALKEVGTKRKRITTDDLWAKIPEDIAQAVEPRAMGAFMQAAAKQGQVKATDRTRPSTRKECHRRPVKVWVSNIFVGREVRS